MAGEETGAFQESRPHLQGGAVQGVTGLGNESPDGLREKRHGVWAVARAEGGGGGMGKDFLMYLDREMSRASRVTLIE